MKFITLVAAVAAVVPAAFALTINSPASVVECEPTQLTWTGGQGPFYLSILPGGQPTATPLETFPTQNGTEYTWDTDLPAGTSISISLKDSTGAIAYSSMVTIQAGSSTSCINSSAQPSGTSASGASTASSGTTAAGTTAAGTTAAGTTAAGTTAAGTTLGSSSSATTTASGSTASGTSTTTSGAGRLSVSSAFCVAGLMGLVGAALF